MTELPNGLPKAAWVKIDWSRRGFYFAHFRGANFRRFQIGWLAVNVRAPWLEHVARRTHPHLFGDKQ